MDKTFLQDQYLKKIKMVLLILMDRHSQITENDVIAGLCTVAKRMSELTESDNPKKNHDLNQVVYILDLICQVIENEGVLRRNIFADACTNAADLIKEWRKTAGLSSEYFLKQILKKDYEASTIKEDQFLSMCQSFYDNKFADKNLGILCRENDGSYGSLPLYDDYDDESTS